MHGESKLARREELPKMLGRLTGMTRKGPFDALKFEDF